MSKGLHFHLKSLTLIYNKLDKNKLMKIVVKQTDELKSSKLHLGFNKIVEEFFVYLTDDNGTPLSCEIVYGKFT